MITAARIKRARRRLDESQEQFAERFCVDQPTISKWEKKGISDRGFTERVVGRILDEIERELKQTKEAAW